MALRPVLGPRLARLADRSTGAAVDRRSAGWAGGLGGPPPIVTDIGIVTGARTSDRSVAAAGSHAVTGPREGAGAAPPPAPSSNGAGGGSASRASLPAQEARPDAASDAGATLATAIRIVPPDPRAVIGVVRPTIDPPAPARCRARSGRSTAWSRPPSSLDRGRFAWSLSIIRTTRSDRSPGIGRSSDESVHSAGGTKTSWRVKISGPDAGRGAIG